MRVFSCPLLGIVVIISILVITSLMPLQTVEAMKQVSEEDTQYLILEAPPSLAMDDQSVCPFRVVLKNLSPQDLTVSVRIEQDRSPHSVLFALPPPTESITAGNTRTVTLYLRVQLDDVGDGSAHPTQFEPISTGMFLTAYSPNMSVSSRPVPVKVQITHTQQVTDSIWFLMHTGGPAIIIASLTAAMVIAVYKTRKP
ncbi:MAG: hypothetical protein HXY34_01410 [Candidatus Thorarchaeota archaeon]|nr:hypothetical protein [Candidatus Thorarchaeota archaeon]